MTARNVSLDVVIVSYRSRVLLCKCLESLDLHPPTCAMRVFVVDNASNDGTVELVRDRFAEVELFANTRNEGFSAANNRAIRAGSGTYVLALNPDTRVRPLVLDRLVRLVEDRPEIGICGCRLELEDGTVDHAAKRTFPTPLSALGHFTGVGKSRFAPPPLAAYRASSVSAGPVDAVNGAFMLIRRRALEEVGLFDEGYWMYMEDLDLCYRFRQAGWVTWYEPSVTVVHVKHGSSGALRTPRLNWAFHYGMYRFYRKHYAGTRNVVVNVVVYVGIAVKLALSVARSGLGRRLVARHRPSKPRSSRGAEA